jgi:hypothetical protein
MGSKSKNESEFGALAGAGALDVEPAVVVGEDPDAASFIEKLDIHLVRLLPIIKYQHSIPRSSGRRNEDIDVRGFLSSPGLGGGSPFTPFPFDGDVGVSGNGASLRSFNLSLSFSSSESPPPKTAPNSDLRRLTF